MNHIVKPGRMSLATMSCSTLLAVVLMLAAAPALAVGATTANAEDAAIVKDATPKDGATLSRPARSLRVWFADTPVVDKCKLELEGPSGTLDVTGLHTMGDDDLMARVSGAMPDGSYTARWTFVGSDGKEKTGSWTFEVKRGSSN